MSYSFYLVCPAKKKMLWIGQNSEDGFNLYYGHEDTMEQLRLLLNETYGEELVVKSEYQMDFDYPDHYTTFEKFHRSKTEQTPMCPIKRVIEGYARHCRHLEGHDGPCEYRIFSEWPRS